jgi:anti-sigma B factor antagonist
MSVAQVPPDSIVGRADGVPPSFVCSCTDGALEAAWVRVAGELDIATAPELERTLREAQSRARLVVLDLRGLSFADSSGLHAVVDASTRAREAGGRLVLLRAPPDVDRTFEMIRSCDELVFGDIDPIEPPVRAAQRSPVSLSPLETGENACHDGRLR